MRAINEIIIHCSATRPDWMEGSPGAAKRDEIRRWHLDHGWNDIGYHDLIDRDGSLITGRPINKVGAHCKGHNTGSIGVCLIGGHGSSENDDFEENYTAAQDDALRKYIKAQRLAFPSIDTISGHNQYAAKACPGFNVQEWYTEAPLVDTPESLEPQTVEPKSPNLFSAIMAALSAIFGGKK